MIDKTGLPVDKESSSSDEIKRKVIVPKKERQRQRAERVNGRNDYIKVLLKAGKMPEQQIKMYYKISQRLLDKLKREVRLEK